MTVEEFDAALTDLETRVDRLRALYENWFRGYEKSEPSVARKEVERRVYHLRKELPRNTALRFRYHQLYLRYTTLANYWQRSARQIEEGTHKLQLNRLRRRVERRDSRERKRETEDEQEPKEDGPPAYELDLDESLNVEDLLDDLEMEEVGRALEPPSEAPAAKLSPGPGIGKFPTPSAADTGLRPLPPSAGKAAAVPPKAPGTGTMLKPEGPPPAGGTGTMPKPPGPVPSKPVAPPAAPGALKPAADPAAALPAKPGLPVPPARPGLPAASTPAATLAGAGRPAPMTPPLAGAGASKQASPSLGGGLPPTRSEPTFDAPTSQQAGLGPRVPPAAPKAPVAPAAPNRAPAPPAPMVSGRAPTGSLVNPVASKPPVPTAPSAPATGAGTSTPAARPAAPTTSARVFGNPATAKAPIPSGGTIVGRPPISSPLAGSSAPDEQRMRRIFDEYTAARRRNNEGEVRYEALVGSIQKMMPELSKKHQGKQIDFEVVVKDGRVGLKPKAT